MPLNKFLKIQKHEIVFSKYVKKIIELHLMSAYHIPGTDNMYYV